MSDAIPWKAVDPKAPWTADVRGLGESKRRRLGDPAKVSRSHGLGLALARDLSATTLPLITDDWGAAQLEESKRTPAQRSYLSTSDELIEELQAADTVVLGAPMYNFSIPSSLKTWIDQSVRIGKTFGYGPNGPRGLLGKKKVLVITARGGAYEKGTTREALDFQEPYLRHILGFLGVTDVTFIHAENQAPEEAGASLAVAAERIGEIASDQSRQAVTH